MSVHPPEEHLRECGGREHVTAGPVIVEPARVTVWWHPPYVLPPETYTGDGRMQMDPGAWRRVTDPEPEPYPASEVTSGVETPEGTHTPSAVLKVAQRLNAAGFLTELAYARGCLPHATTGRPGPVRDSWRLAVLRSGVSGWATYRGGWDFLYIGQRKIKSVTEWEKGLIE